MVAVGGHTGQEGEGGKPTSILLSLLSIHATQALDSLCILYTPLRLFFVLF